VQIAVKTKASRRTIRRWRPIPAHWASVDAPRKRVVAQTAIKPYSCFADARTLQTYLGHRNIQHTVRYTELSPTRFKNFWPE
jgi:hypothetical protein